jgi:hypothetical protein
MMTISGTVMTFSGAVATISGVVVNCKCIPILIFICGFCRGEGEKGFHGDDFLKGSVR